MRTQPMLRTALCALVLLALLSAHAGFGPTPAAEAQDQPPGKIYRVGFLSQGQPPKVYMDALRQGLR